MRTCANSTCSNPVYRSNQKYCSTNCRVFAYNKRKREKETCCQCVQCLIYFRPAFERKYCSIYCENIAREEFWRQIHSPNPSPELTSSTFI